MENLSSSKRKRLCVGASNCSSKGFCGCIFKGLSSCTTAKGSLGVLTDDLLRKIFLRLPVKFVHRAKCVSNRWRALISSPYFIRSFMLTRLSGYIKDDPHEHHSAKMMILFHLQISLRTTGQVCTLPLLHDDFNKVSSSSLTSTFDFIPALKSVRKSGKYDLDDDLITPRRFKTERQLVDVYLIGTYGGLVLLQGIFLKSIDVTPSPHSGKMCHYYYVCNPVNKQWVELPPISIFNLSGFTCYYPQQGESEEGDSRIWADIASYENIIKHNTNFDPNKIEFTVVSLDRNRQDDVFKISVFSSDETAGWRIFHVPFPRGYRWSNENWRPTNETLKLLFFNGRFHWCGANCIAVYDPFDRPQECDTIPFPPIDSLDDDTSTLHLEACEGRLRLVNSFKTGRFSVWELLDYANKVWVKIIDVNYDGDLIFQSFVGGTDGDKVYMLSRPSTIMLLDVRDASLQHVYTYSEKFEFNRYLQFVESFLPSPWPTRVPMIRRS